MRPCRPAIADLPAVTAAGPAAGWRLVLGTGTDAGLAPASGAANMAIDTALFEAVQAGAPPVIRFYLWRPACLSLGRNQPARGLYDPDRAARRGIDIVRRPTGGLAVLHDAELTYAVIAPVTAVGRPRAAYLAINNWLAAALRRLGVPAGLAAQPDAAPGTTPAAAWSAAAELPAPPCFQAPAAGEIVARGGKLVGSAQRYERHTLLQHGSILLAGSQLDVRELEYAPATTTPVAALANAPGAAAGTPDVAGTAVAGTGSTTLAALLGAAPAPADLVAAACAALAAAGTGAFGGIALARGRLARRERERAHTLEAHYRSGHWTWRR